MLIKGALIADGQTWPTAGMGTDIYLEGLTVNAGASLTLQPGVTLHFDYGSGFYGLRALNARARRPAHPVHGYGNTWGGLLPVRQAARPGWTMSPPSTPRRALLGSAAVSSTI